MKIGILSDTHDQRVRTETAVALLRAEGADVLIHCGDLVRPEMVAICTSLPCYFVFGNNDADDAIQAAVDKTSNGTCLENGGIVQLANKQIAVTHGHLIAEIRRLSAANPDYLLSGHSHIAADWYEGTTRRINPGALHRASKFSVAILDLETDVLRFLEIGR